VKVPYPAWSSQLSKQQVGPACVLSPLLGPVGLRPLMHPAAWISRGSCRPAVTGRPNGDLFYRRNELWNIPCGQPVVSTHALASAATMARARGIAAAPLSSSDTSCDLGQQAVAGTRAASDGEVCGQARIQRSLPLGAGISDHRGWCTTKIGSQMAPSSGPAAAAGSANSLLTWEFWSGWPDLNRRPLRPEANKRRRLPGLGVPDLGSTVHRCPLASIAGDGDSYSLGYSPLAHARTGLLARPDP